MPTPLYRGNRAQHCPPSCANNPLSDLFDRHCSDKGTDFMSKHHYSTAYHAIFGSIRRSVTSLLEIGIGEDQAPSVASWSQYFPFATIYAVDVKSSKRFRARAKPGKGVDKDNKRLWWCTHNRSMWDNPRIQLHLDTDATRPAQLARVPLPAQLDVIIDDGSHKFPDQEVTLRHLWSKLRPGGLYIVEDILVGDLPWDRFGGGAQGGAQGGSHGAAVPTSNKEGCKGECFFPQRLAEHPFMHDRFGQLKGAAAPRHRGLHADLKPLFAGAAADWFWVVTGVHAGGGLDCALVLRKPGPALGTTPPLLDRPLSPFSRWPSSSHHDSVETAAGAACPPPRPCPPPRECPPPPPPPPPSPPPQCPPPLMDEARMVVLRGSVIALMVGLLASSLLNVLFFVMCCRHQAQDHSARQARAKAIRDAAARRPLLDAAEEDD